jgi:peptidoglycan/LPS O-acetylase OafA/YrhL
MSRRPDRRFLENVLTWVVLVVCFAMITPWANTLRHSLAPRFAIFIVVIGTLAGAASLVSGLVAAFSKYGGRSAAAIPLSIGCGLLLLAASFLSAEQGTGMSSYTIWGAALFMVVAAVLQGRVSERAE